MASISAALSRAVRPRSSNEDRARREFIFNVLALSALVLLFIAIVDNTIHALSSEQGMHQADSLSSVALYGLFAFFAFLYALSSRGWALIASYLFLAALFDLAAYMGYRWGVDLSASLLFYALTITMAGILVSAPFAFVVAILSGAAIGVTTHLHRTGIFQPDRSWITELWKADDVLVTTLIFLVLATVMWLSNREIEKSLARARRSEADLKLERDQLEIRVEERTKELRQAELERMTQAYRFVEFGRIASGVFHDLMNPLAGLALNIERIATASEKPRTADVERARLAADHMQALLGSMRPHFKRQAREEWFSLRGCIEGATRLMTTYAREHEVEFTAALAEDRHVFGDSVALTQALMNLLGNAVQAYEGTSAERRVEITLSSTEAEAVIRVADHGKGIAHESISRVFEPYFTTKGEDGIGLGLALTKRIIEKDFGGSISVESAIGAGTSFTVYLPIREP